MTLTYGKDWLVLTEDSRAVTKVPLLIFINLETQKFVLCFTSGSYWYLLQCKHHGFFKLAPLKNFLPPPPPPTLTPPAVADLPFAPTLCLLGYTARVSVHTTSRPPAPRGRSGCPPTRHLWGDGSHLGADKSVQPTWLKIENGVQCLPVMGYLFV